MAARIKNKKLLWAIGIIILLIFLYNKGFFASVMGSADIPRGIMSGGEIIPGIKNIYVLLAGIIIVFLYIKKGKNWRLK